MLRSLTTAATGMIAQQNNLDIVANNIAELENKRVVALYNTSKGKVNIIKEEGHKITTILFAYEY